MAERWTRDKISSCSCSEKPYRHVHWPCSICKGKATTRSTELRHRSQAQVCAGHDSDFSSDLSVSDQSDIEPCTATMDLDIEEEDTSTDDPEEMTTHGEEWSPVSEPEAMNVDPTESPEDDGTGANKEEGDVNPLRRLIVKAVLDAMAIMEDSGTSKQTFEDILEYGEKMLFTSVGDDIDIDILSVLWSKSWNAAQLLLKEEGFSDAKVYYICMCREAKEFTRNGQTSTKYHYNRMWSVMESQDELCRHCG